MEFGKPMIRILQFENGFPQFLFGLFDDFSKSFKNF